MTDRPDIAAILTLIASRPDVLRLCIYINGVEAERDALAARVKELEARLRTARNDALETACSALEAASHHCATASATYHAGWSGAFRDAINSIRALKD